MAMDAVPVDMKCPHCKKKCDVSVDRMYLQDIKTELLVCKCSKCSTILEILKMK